MVKTPLKGLIRKTGRSIDTLKRDAKGRRMKLIRSKAIDIVLDIGANTGQYALELRRMGWKGPIVSFEPLGQAYRILSEKTRRERAWNAHHFALGDKNVSLPLNVSGDPRASSFLEMLPSHIAVGAYFKTVAREIVPVRTLDSVIDECAPRSKRVFLKIDAQGYEKRILAGARRTLRRVQGIQIEMSLCPLYRGESSIESMLGLMRRLGFRLMSLEYGFTEPRTGRMLQVDGIFFRE